MKMKKKTYLLPQKLINNVKKVTGSKTETEAIIQALENLSFNIEMNTWLQKHAGKMNIRDLYG